MKIIDEELMSSEYITVDERGWHISENAPDELKEKFNEFIEGAQEGMVIELEG